MKLNSFIAGFSFVAFEASFWLLNDKGLPLFWCLLLAGVYMSWFVEFIGRRITEGMEEAL